MTVQLICHFLELPDLLRFACCARTFRTAADTPFAVKHASLSFTYAPDRVLADLNSPVIRHAPLAVRWDPSVADSDDSPDLMPDVRALIAFLSARKASIVSLNGLSSPPIPDDAWIEILDLPSMQSVRALSMTRERIPGGDCTQDAGFLAKVATLPNLTSFTLIKLSARHADSLCLLAPAPMLTSLTLLDAEFSSCLSQLILFPRLKFLAVVAPGGGAAVLHAALCSSVNLHRTLERLELDGLYWIFDDALADVTQPLAKFARLQTVVLRRVLHPEVWLTGLLAAPALSSLVLEPLCRMAFPYTRLAFPDEKHSAGPLSRLMLDKPALKLTLIVWAGDASKQQARAQPAPYLTTEVLRGQPPPEAIEQGLAFARLLEQERLVQMRDRFAVLYL